MSYGFLDIATTPSVRAVQAAMGSDGLWDREGDRTFDRFGPDEAAFIAARDSFYMATVSETGWPYVQHRGGPRGFLKLVDDRTLAFADFRGNRQYISTGNIMAGDRACLFLMDYPHRARLKIYVHAEIVALDTEPELEALVATPAYRGRAERLIRLRLAAFDWNCSQHITPRFTTEDIAAAMRRGGGGVVPDEAIDPDVVERLRARIAALEAENAALSARLAGQATDPQ